MEKGTQSISKRKLKNERLMGHALTIFVKKNETLLSPSGQLSLEDYILVNKPDPRCCTSYESMDGLSRIFRGRFGN